VKQAISSAGRVRTKTAFEKGHKKMKVARVMLGRGISLSNMKSSLCSLTLCEPASSLRGTDATIWRTYTSAPTRLGIADSMMSYANNKMEGSREKKFAEMIDLMTQQDASKWTLRMWKSTIEKQLDSWTMYIPGISGTNEVQQLKGFKTVLDAMSPAELDDPHKVNGIARDRISRMSGRSTDEVAKVIVYYRQSLIIATWIQAKKENGEKLPSTEEEMLTMQEEDPRLKNIANDVMRPKKAYKRSGRGQRSPF